MLTLNNVAIAVVFFLVGYITQLGYMKVRGHQIIVPHLASGSRTLTILSVILALICLTTIYNVDKNAKASAAQAEAAAECDRQFREALTYNTTVTSEQREISDRATQISRDRRQILDKMFVDIGNALPGDPARIPAIVKVYNDRARQLGVEYDDLIRYRGTLDAKRAPYPDPSCGR